MKRSDQFPEVRNIADAVCEGCATEEQLAKLELLLRGNFDAQHFYYDYINMNAQLSDSPGRSTEITYRRMTEEVVVRSHATPTPNEPKNTFEIPKTEHNSNKPSKHIALVLILLSGVIFCLLWLIFNRNTTPAVAHLIEGNIVSLGQGKISGDALLAGDYRSIQDATIQLVDGDTLYLSPNATVKIFNNREVKLKIGRLALKALTKENTIVHTRSFILQTNGTDLSVALEYPAPIVISGKNTQVTPLRWRPTHFWNFNGQGDRVVDAAGSAYGVVGSGANRVKGLVGQGAFIFDHSENSQIELGSGGGTVPGSGSFAVTDGVTIEALVRSPDASNDLGLDNIFRKDSADGEPRVLLNFHHNRVEDSVDDRDDSRGDDLNREGVVHSSVNFGLFILGQGYSELTLPLDGQYGRPNLTELTDGNPHHIVGTYDAVTGFKAIYIDGVKRASYQHAPGSSMLSGGAGAAVIGNMVDENSVNNKNSFGIIDEVSFYDFALGELVIKQHLLNITQGYNYYGLRANTDSEKITLPQRPRLSLQPYTTYEMIPKVGLPARIVKKLN